MLLHPSVLFGRDWAGRISYSTAKAVWTLKLLPILLQGFESEMSAGSLKVAAAFVSVVQRDAAMAEFSL